MADYRSEDPDGGFKKTFVAIAVVHLILLGGLFVAALFQSKKNTDTVVWMNPGSFGGQSSAAGPPAAVTTESSVAPSEEAPAESQSQQETQSKTTGEEEAPHPPPPVASATPPPIQQSELPVATPTPTPP